MTVAEKVAEFIAAATSIRLADYVARISHPAYRYRSRSYAWPARYWEGAWCTQSGHIIEAYLDDLHMEIVKEERNKETNHAET